MSQAHAATPRQRLGRAEVEAVEVEERRDQRQRRENRDREETGARLAPGRAENDVEEQEEARPIGRADEGGGKRRLDRPREVAVRLVGEGEELGPGDGDEDRGDRDEETERRVHAAALRHQFAPSRAPDLRTESRFQAAGRLRLKRRRAGAAGTMAPAATPHPRHSGPCRRLRTAPDTIAGFHMAKHLLLLPGDGIGPK